MPSPSHKERLDNLSRHLGRLARFKESGRLSTDQHVLQAYSQDLWPRKLVQLREKGPLTEPTVDLVLWPQSVEEVSELVKWGSSSDSVIYPYGAGSGVCGGTVPAENEKRSRIIIDLKKMSKVRSIDNKSMTVWAEAGLIGENLERYLNQEGFTLGHFPSSIYCSSLGGYLATRSAGQLSTKYGKIEDMVLSLECVLPDGSILETSRAPRSAMGPDFTQFLLGTEGTLVIFTAACLQINTIPEVRVMRSFQAEDVYSAMEFARNMMQDGLRPSAIRIYDPLETSLTLSSEVLEKSGYEAGAAVVVVFEGLRALAEVEAAEAEKIAERTGIKIIGDELATHWWNHRYDISYKQQLILSHERMILDTFELAATWSNLTNVYKAVKSVNVGFGVVLGHLSHFYHTGANIYFTLVSHAGIKRSSIEHYDDVWDAMLRAAVGAGATLSHHHGVGSLKRDWIRKEKGQWINIFERIKGGFDPESRFNPDKMGL